MKCVKEFWENEKVGVVVTTLISFVIHLVVLQSFDCWMSTDTDGYWLHAATFTGHDWSGVAQNMPNFYAWGYSVFLIIPFLLTHNFGTMYRIAILINVVLCSLVVPISYSIGKKIVGDVNRRVLLLFALIVSCYSTYILESGVSLAESLIYFVYWFVLWTVYHYLHTRDVKVGVLASVAVGYAYIVHHRNIGIVVAFVIMAIFLLWKERKIKDSIFLLLPLACMIGLDLAVTNWLQIKESTMGVYTTNTYQSMAKKATTGMNLYAIISMMQNVIGEIWYSIVGTFMVGAVGIYYMMRDVISSSKRKFSEKQIFFVFTMLSWALQIGVSSYFCLRKSAPLAGKVDVIIYGRYMEATIGVLVLIGMLAMYKAKWNLNTLKIGLGILVFSGALSILTHYFTTAYEYGSVNMFSIVAVLFPISIYDLKFVVAKSSFALLAVGITILFLFINEKRIYKWLAGFTILMMFLLVGYNATYTVSRYYKEQAGAVNNPTYNSEFNAIQECINENNIDRLVICTDDGYEAFPYQFVNRDADIISVVDENQIENIPDDYYVLIDASKITKELKERVLFTGERYYLCNSKKADAELISSMRVDSDNDINILWLGTSIPMGNQKGNYPSIVDEMLGEQVHIFNISKSASTTRSGYYECISEDDELGIYGFHDYFRSLMKSVSLSQDEKRIIYNDWSQICDRFAYDGSFDTPSDNMELYLSCSYDGDLKEYLEKYKIDYVIYDMGYNDVTCGDYSDTDDVKQIPEKEDDRTYYIGASKFIFDKIKSYSPDTRIIIAGHYSNNDYPYLVEAQEMLANQYDLPIYKTWEDTNWTASAINMWCPDGIHPGNDESQAANEFLARIHAKGIKNILDNQL